MVVLYEERVIQGTNFLKRSYESSEILYNFADQTQCWIELGTPGRWQIYMSLVAASLFVLPAIIIAACYAIIVRTIWSKGSLLMSTGKDL